MKRLKTVQTIILITIVVFFIATVILSIPLVGGDEFINYQNAYKIFNGEIIYKDVNVLSTPLLFYIAIVFFNILGPNLIVFRIYNICINVAVVMIIYIIFKNLKLSKSYSIIYTLLLEILIVTYVSGNGATYNILGLLISLIGINFYITKRKTQFNSLIQGTIIFLGMMTKQNIGIYYGLAYVLIELILNRKKGIKKIIKTFAVTIEGWIIYIAYLIMVGNIDGFISYTILGIKEFSKNLLIEGIGFIVFDIIAILLILICLYKRKYKKEYFENIIILFIFGIFMILLGYPIADDWHMVVASIVLYISGIYMVHTSKIDEMHFNPKTLLYIIILIIYYMIVSGATATFRYVKNVYINEDNKYNLITIQEDMSRKITIMESYIAKSDKQVVIVSPEARII